MSAWSCENIPKCGKAQLPCFGPRKLTRSSAPPKSQVFEKEGS
jgi:hypothetical protein